MTRALLIIDVQESFRQRPLWRTISNQDLANDLIPLLDAAPQGTSWSGSCTQSLALAPPLIRCLATSGSSSRWSLQSLEQLIGHGTSVESAARAVGFADARMLRRLRAAVRS